MSNMEKLWERPWTSEEMKENAENWNLAGDAGLLKHLQQFSQELIVRTHSTNSAMDDMFRKLNNLATEINNVNNTFLSLANTQFVENRVYEDEEKDSPLAEKEQVAQPKSKEAMEAEMIQRVKLSIEIGFAVMDTKFNAIEVSGSDSEDDGAPSSVIRTVLEPNNPYLHWPLPHLIGSAEFTADDSVGLVTAVEDVMTPPLTTHSSSSDVNEDLVQESQKSLVKQASEWLSETEDVDMFGRDSSPDDMDFDASNSQQAKSAASFAEELSSKLGGVASSGFDKKPVQQWDEPAKSSASLNDSIISTKSAVSSLFGPSNDLFHNDDDEIFTVKDKNKSEVPPLFENDSPTSQILESSSPKKGAEPPLEASQAERKLSHNVTAFSTPLFDDDVDFSISGNISKINKQSGLFDDDGDDDDLFSASLSKPKEAVAHQLFQDTSSISPYEASNQTLDRPFLESRSSGQFGSSDNSNVPVSQENESETVDKSADSAPANWPNKSVRDSLFDEEGASDSLFHASSRDSPKLDRNAASNKKLLSLFDEEQPEATNASLVTEEKPQEKSLFDDEDLFSQSSHAPNYDIFASNQGKITTDDDLFAIQSSSDAASNIFKEDTDETDDIFSVPNSSPHLNQEVEDLFSTLPGQNSPVSEPKMNPPSTLSIKMPDLFLDSDDADTDLFGANTKASSNKNTSSLFDAPSTTLHPVAREVSPQLDRVTEPPPSKEEKPVSKAIPNLKEKQLGLFKDLPPTPLKGNGEDLISDSITKEETIHEAKSWSRDKVIGKIKSPIGFLVDPLALLPGSKPPPREKPTTNEPAIGGGSNHHPINTGVVNSLKEKHPSEIVVDVAGTSTNTNANTNTLPTSSFGTTDVGPTLHSAVKERAKIQVKRRPQSRRSRHEAIRKSALFADGEMVFPASPAEPISIIKDSSPEKPKIETSRNLLEPETSVNRTLKSVISDETAKEMMSAEVIASPSTDEEDLFGVPQVSYKDKADGEDQLFGSATVLSPYGEKHLGAIPKVDTSASSKSSQSARVEKQPKGISHASADVLLSDPFSSDENLFASSTLLKDNLLVAPGTSSAISSKTGLSRPKGNAKSLFDDEDDDDIFSKFSKTATQITTRPVEVKPSRAGPPVVKAALKKIEDPFDDPLSSLP